MVQTTMTEPVYCQLCGTTEKVEIVFGLSGGDSMLKVCPACKKICENRIEEHYGKAKLPSTNPNPYTKCS
jgi:ribosome-binding protein aMBF1 (putative translation factor)